MPPTVKQPITEDECRALAATMLRPEVGGNLAAAAKLLNMPYNRACKVAKKDLYIRALQPGVDPASGVPSETDTINRAPMAPGSLEDARAMVRQERLLSKQDWEALGITTEQAERMIELERFAKLPLAHSIFITHGGMMSGYARLTAIFDKYADELEKQQLPTEEVRAGKDFAQRDQGDVERDWVYALVSLSAERRAVYAQLQKGRLQLLKAQQMAKELNGGKGKGPKPVGPPILVNEQSGSNVQLAAPSGHESPGD